MGDFVLKMTFSSTNNTTQKWHALSSHYYVFLAINLENKQYIGKFNAVTYM